MPSRGFHVEPDGGAFIVNELKAGAQTFPDIAVTGPGKATVVWQGPYEAGKRVGGIWLRRIDRDGPVGIEQLLDPSFTAYAASYPKIAVDPEGTSLTAWAAEAGVNGDQGGAFARMAAADGTPLGDEEISLHESLEGGQIPSDVVWGSEGFFVVWNDDEGLNMPSRLRIRLFDSTGEPRTDEITIVEGLPYFSNQMQPAAALPDGRYALTWTRENLIRTIYLDGEGHIVNAMLFDDGTEVSPSSIASCDDGRHLIVWHVRTSEPAGSMLRGLWIAADMEAIGEIRDLHFTAGNWSPYATAPTTMMPGCTAIIGAAGRFFFESPDGSVGVASSSISPAEALAAYSEREFVVARSAASDIVATRYCIVRDEESCGDATCIGDIETSGSDRINIRDAIRALRAATGMITCQLCQCDTDSSGSTTATDAARILRFVVGLPIDLACPACIHE